MTLTALALLMGVASFAAGLLGALTGLGGGIVVVPLLTLVFHVDLRYAVGASLIAVIATSSGSAAAYVREGFSNVRIAIVLEIATTVGALIGAALIVRIEEANTHLFGMTPKSALAVLFGLVLFASAYRSRHPPAEHIVLGTPDKWAARLRLDSTYPTANGLQPYSVQHIPAGFALMFVAGLLSALLGIGSGIIKVIAMDQTMHMPFKVSTTTSNFMIGVTAAAGAGVYLHQGYIDPALAFPVMVGATSGAWTGARVLTHVNVRWLRQLFTGIVIIAAIEMLYKGMTGTI